MLQALPTLSTDELRKEWRRLYRSQPPRLSRDLLVRAIAYRIQALAAFFSALAPESIRGLILLGAPLCFEPASSQFRDALVSLVRQPLSEGDPLPGSLLSFITTLASPSTFIWGRMRDAILSVPDRQALEIHARVERWALDEVALSGKLVQQISGFIVTTVFVGGP